MKAIGQKNEIEENKIEIERQALRDFPEKIKSDLDLAKTIEEIKMIILS